MKLAVIGGGPAGMAAAVSARKTASKMLFSSSVTIISAACCLSAYTQASVRSFTKGTIQGANTPGCGLKKHCLRVLM